jgi:hypothetical protein
MSSWRRLPHQAHTGCREIDKIIWDVETRKASAAKRRRRAEWRRAELAAERFRANVSRRCRRLATVSTGVEYAGTICLGYGMTDQTHLLAIVIRYVGAIVHKRRSRDI